MKHWVQYSKELKIMGLPLTSASAILVSPRLHFMHGYRFDQEGLKPTPEKVQGIYECEPPRSKTEVRSFLGMTGYLSKFIPRYASLTKPLRDLTRTDTEFHEDLQKTRHLRTLRALLQARTLLQFSTPNYQLWYVWKLATMKGYQRVSSSNLLRVGSQYISLVDH